MSLRAYRSSLQALVFFFVSAIIMTYPLILHLFDGIAGTGKTGEPLASICDVNWVKRALVDLRVDFRHFDYATYPYGIDVLKEMNFSVALFLTVPLTIIGGPIFGYNFFFLLSLPLSAFAMYLFVKHMTKNELAAVFSGFAFGFSPYHFARGFAGHINLFGTWWIPLMLLCLHKAIEGRRLRDSALAAVFFVLASATSGYYGAMCLTLILCIAVFYAATMIRRNGFGFKINLTGDKIDQALRISIPFLILSLPLIAYLDYIGPPGQLFDKETIAIYSASPGDYLRLGFLHPIWRFLGAQPSGRGYPWEQALYVGVSTMVLALLGLTLSRERTTWLYFFIALLFFTLSLGPMLWIDDTLTSIQLPYSFLSDYIPMLKSMRALARFGLIVMLAVSLLAGLGLKSMLEKLKQAQGRLGILHDSGILLTTVLILVVALEFASTPFPYINLSEIEGVQAYRWLANQPGDFAIAEYPIDWQTDGRAMFGTAIHGKRTVSGKVDFPTPEVSRQMNEMVNKLSFFQPDFSGKIDLGLYRSLNIKYVLFHRGTYVKEFGFENWKRAIELANAVEDLKFIGEFGETLVYEVS